MVVCVKKAAKRWLWIALCRRTRQIVAFVIGDRSDATCRRLWNKIPEGYRVCHSYSDFWAAYQKVFSSETHQAVGKESGQTAHVERWNNTLRQRLARFVRKTLSFPNRTSITTSSPNGLSRSTTWPYHLPSSHYQQFKALFCGPGMRRSCQGAENLLPVRGRYPQPTLRWTLDNAYRNAASELRRTRWNRVD